MEFWVDENFAATGAIGTEQIAPYLSSVLVSYYEDDCNDIQPDWPPVFDHLGTVFKDAALGFGECGTQQIKAKVQYVERYYQGMDLNNPEYANMHIDHPRYIGGFFWWYFSEDMSNTEVYSALQNSLVSPFWKDSKSGR